MLDEEEKNDEENEEGGAKVPRKPKVPPRGGSERTQPEVEKDLALTGSLA